MKLLPWGAACAFLLLGACDDPDKVAGGTGTTAGNTITARVLHGTVMTVDGAPSSRTVVVARPSNYRPHDLALSNPLSATGSVEAVTDSAGRFSLRVDSGTSYLVECHRGKGEDAQVAWRENLRFEGGNHEIDLGPIAMSQGAALTGLLRADSAGAWFPLDAEAWVGFPGTDVFTRVGGGGGFSLEEIPPGARELEILRLVDGEIRQRLIVSGWRLFAGTRSVLEPVVFASPGSGIGPAASSGPDSVSHAEVRACMENPASLIEAEYSGATGGGDTQVLRAVMDSNPPKWIELDPCLGTWRTLTTLPGVAAKASGAFSNADADFIALGSLHKVLRIGRDGSVEQISIAAGLGLVSADYYGGSFYALPMGGTRMRVYADEGSLWNDVPIDSVDLGYPVDDFQDVAILNNVVYLGVKSDSLHLFDFDLSRRRGAWNLYTKADSRLTGLTTAADGHLWFLTGSKELIAYDPMTGSPVRRYSISAPFALRGLTRYRPKTALKSEMEYPVPAYP